MPVAVKTGLTDLEYSEIVSGLEPGDRVLLLPSTSLYEQQERLAAVHLAALRLEHAVPAATSSRTSRVSSADLARLASRYHRAVPSSREFALPGFTLAAEVWGTAGGVPVLASHGWLDNASTFDLLAPLLAGCEIVALDLAGHGLSGSRSPDAAYNIWEDVGDLLDVRDAARLAALQRCSAIRAAPRSRCCSRATFPEHVDKLDAARRRRAADSGSPAEAPATLARSFRERAALRSKSGPRVHASAPRRSRSARGGFTKVTPAAAEMLARRSLREVPGGFQWHADQRLKGSRSCG